MRYKLTLSYNGASFCGYQIQNNAPSVQGCIENCLSTLLHETISIVGAGRTDTGVHAKNYVAHFDCSHAITNPDDTESNYKALIYKLNAILPSSIVIHSIERVKDDFHARFDAKLRAYEYHIHRSKDPFAEQFSYQWGYPDVDFDDMNRAAKLLLGTKDFSCFEKIGADNKSSICTIYEAYWTKEDETHWAFHIAANRFLRNMVRAIVGTLLDVGRGKRTVESIPSLIENKQRCEAGQSVPGHALFLTRIEY